MDRRGRTSRRAFLFSQNLAASRQVAWNWRGRGSTRRERRRSGEIVRQAVSGRGGGVCFAVMFMGCLSMRPERHQGQVLHSARRQARSRASEQPWAMASDVPDVLRGSGPWDAFVCRFHDLLAAAQWAPFAAVTEGALGSHREALPPPALF